MKTTPEIVADVRTASEPQVRSSELVVPLTYPACWILSCDTCRYQEGRHYCLLHGKPMKNMDTITCDQWQDRGGKKRHNSEVSDRR